MRPIRCEIPDVQADQQKDGQMVSYRLVSSISDKSLVAPGGPFFPEDHIGFIGMLIGHNFVNRIGLVPLFIVRGVMALGKEIMKSRNLFIPNESNQRLLVLGKGRRVDSVLLINIFKRGQDHSSTRSHDLPRLCIQRKMTLKVGADMKVN